MKIGRNHDFFYGRRRAVLSAKYRRVARETDLILKVTDRLLKRLESEKLLSWEE